MGQIASGWGVIDREMRYEEREKAVSRYKRILHRNFVLCKVLYEK